MKKMLGLFQLKGTVFFFPSKLLLCPSSLPSASLEGEGECDLYVGLPMEFCMCVISFFFLISSASLKFSLS